MIHQVHTGPVTHYKDQQHADATPNPNWLEEVNAAIDLCAALKVEAILKQWDGKTVGIIFPDTNYVEGELFQSGGYWCVGQWEFTKFDILPSFAVNDGVAFFQLREDW